MSASDPSTIQQSTPQPGPDELDPDQGNTEQESEDLEHTDAETDRSNEADQSKSVKPLAMVNPDTEGQAAVAGPPLGN